MAELDNRLIREAFTDATPLVSRGFWYVLAASYCTYLLFCQSPVLGGVGIEESRIDGVADVLGGGSKFQVTERAVPLVPVLVIDFETARNGTVVSKPNRAVQQTTPANATRRKCEPVVRPRLVWSPDFFQTLLSPHGFGIWSTTMHSAVFSNNQYSLQNGGENFFNTGVFHPTRYTTKVEV